MTDAEFRLSVRLLRRALPTSKPVRVRRLAVLPKNWAEEELAACCWDAGSYFVIALDAASTNLRDDLAHEWAHLVSGSGSHKKRWLMAYGRARQVFWPE